MSATVDGPHRAERDHVAKPRMTGELRESLALLGTRRFGTFFAATFLSNIGTWAQQVAEPWLLLSLGASSFLIGLDSFASNAPVWLLTLVGGYLADHADRRRIIALFQAIQMLCPTLIVVLLLVGRVPPALIIVLSLIVGVTDALSMPSFQSIVPSIVKREQIARGLALNSVQFNLSRIAGPALAGALMAAGGTIVCFGLNAASYLPFIGVALWILPRRRPRPLRGDPHTARPLAGLWEAASSQEIRGALLTVLATSLLCGPILTFAPVLVSTVFHGSAGKFSLVMGAFGVGGLLGGVALLAAPAQHDHRRWSSFAAVSYAAVVLIAAVLPSFSGLPLLMTVAGAAMTVSNTSANSLLQSRSSPAQLGRSVSLFMLAMRGGLSIGSLLTGLSVDLMGVRYALALNGALALLVQCALGWWWTRGPIVHPSPRESLDSSP